MSLLYLDIETTPIIGYTWGIWETNVIRKHTEWYILSFAYKWEGEKKVYFVKSNGDDQQLLKKLHPLLDKATFVVAHNGKKFDLKKIRARMMKWSMKPYAPIKVIDTLLSARKHGFDSKKLDDLGEYLGVGRKVKHEGFDLWLGCMSNNATSWATMEKYNKQDVLLLERVYKRLRIWDETHPVIDYQRMCKVCGSDNIQFRGWSHAMKPKREYSCNDCYARRSF